MTAVMLSRRAPPADGDHRRGPAARRDRWPAGLAATAQAARCCSTTSPRWSRTSAQAAARGRRAYAIVLDADGACRGPQPSGPELRRLGAAPTRWTDRADARPAARSIQETGAPTDRRGHLRLGGCRSFVEPPDAGARRASALSRLRMDAEPSRRRAGSWASLTAITLLLGGLGAALRGPADRAAGPASSPPARQAVARGRARPVDRARHRRRDRPARRRVQPHDRAAAASSAARSRTPTPSCGSRLEELAELEELHRQRAGLDDQRHRSRVDLDGRVVTLNPAAEMMTGFFAGRGDGRYCADVLRGHSPQLGEILMETIASRTGLRQRLAVTVRRPNGAHARGRDQRRAAARVARAGTSA